MTDTESLTLTNHTALRAIARLHEVSWWRGASNSGDRVVVEYASASTGNGEALAWLRRESDVISAMDLDCTMKPLAWVREQHGAALIFEDRGTEPIALQTPNVGARPRVEVQRVLTIAATTARALTQLHDRSMIHGRLSPDSIWFDADSGRIELTDLGRAARVVGPGSQRWTTDALRYASPEHTGRVARQVDHRSDIYSLGAVVYALLTGHPPFEAADIASLIHAHVARTPTPALTHRPDAPVVLSRILERLLQKSPEDRYQSTEALADDLERCLKEHVSGVVSDFAIGASDRSRRLKLPEKIYGRAAELERMRTAKDARVLFVKGKAGIGKSALVEAYGRGAVKDGARVAYGKFEQYRRDMIHGALADALRDVTRQLLSEPDAVLRATRERLTARLGANASALFELIPELRTVVSDSTQAEPVKLGPTETTHRFQQLVVGYLHCVATPSQPLVLVLDDLQWAGVASLGLLELILVEGPKDGFQVVVPFRADEVATGSPVAASLARVTSKQLPELIDLGPLRIEDLLSFMVDALGRDVTEVRPLARLIHQRSEGNPFVARELVHRMHDEGLLSFDEQHRTWVWDLERISHSRQGGGIVELLANEIGRLPADARNLLRVAACMGSSIDVETLGTVVELPIEQVDRHLQKIAEALFIQPTAAHRTAELSDGELTVFVPRYAFRHDRIQQAAYSLVPDNERATTHLRIGRLLKRSLAQGSDTVSLIQATEQLNAGRDLIDDENERQDLAQLNLTASKRARAATSWTDARRFIEIADEVVHKKAATSLVYEIGREHALVEYLNGEAAAVRDVVDKMLPILDDPLQRATLLCQLVVLDTAQGDYQTAIAQGRRALAELGISLPEENLLEALDLELERTEVLRAGRDFGELSRAPEMTDPINKLAVRILVELDSPAYLSDQDLYAVVVSQMVSLSLEHGPVPESSKAYASFGIVLGPKLGRYEDALHFNELGIAISERFDDKGQECRACHTMANHTLSWSKPIRATNAFNDRGFRAGYAAGEILWCGYIRMFKVHNCFFEGRPLHTILADTREALTFSVSTGNQVVIDALEGMLLTLRALTGKTRDEEHTAFVEKCKTNSSALALGLYLCVRAEAELVAGRPDRALELCDEAEPYMPFVLGIIVVVGRNVVASLAALELCADADQARRADLLARVASNQHALGVWAKSCPQNFQCRWLLVEAEKARLDGELLRASTLFDESASKAEAEGFMQIEALGHERQARLWHAANKPEVAKVYRARARAGFDRWAARTKSVDLNDGTHTSRSIVQAERELVDLDLEAVMEAARAISGELQRDRLNRKILDIMVVISGAQWGHLILDSEHGLYVAATVGPDDALTAPVPLADHDGVAEGIVRFAFRTGEETVLSEACSDGPFTADPCVVKRQVRSLLATPFSVHGKTRGVLYLTNELVAGAFDSGRRLVLRMLLDHATVSLSNAELFSRLERQTDVLRADIAARERAEAERAQLEDEVRQLQKLEAMGTLAAGIAHDFNNLLFVMLANTEIVLETTESLNKRTRASLNDIMAAGSRAQALIRQILTFARDDEQALMTVDLRSETEEAVRLLQHSLHPDIEVMVTMGGHSLPVAARSGELQQLLLNLCTNAGHAIDGPGRIEVSLGSVTLHETTVVGTAELPPGRYHEVSVSDSGSGMSPETLQNAFHPFFTTKDVGEGTGLGLAIVRRIVQERAGAISATSELGVGSKFQVYLPVAHGTTEVRNARTRIEPIGSGERILFVDDEPAIVRLLSTLLTTLGFEPRCVGDGRIALEMLRSEPDSYDLLISDVRMPGLNGIDLARAASFVRKDLPILLLTGKGIGDEAQLLEDGIVTAVVPKPVTSGALGEAIAKALGMPARTTAKTTQR